MRNWFGKLKDLKRPYNPCSGLEKMHFKHGVQKQGNTGGDNIKLMSLIESERF